MHTEEGFALPEPYKWINEHKTWAVGTQLTPSSTAARQMDFAAMITSWDLHEYSYNAIVFYNPELFQSYGKMEAFHWGRISRPEEVPKEKRVLGVMVFDPKPQTILQIAKAMAKRRPKDPLVIFDLYGNTFYPV